MKRDIRRDVIDTEVNKGNRCNVCEMKLQKRSKKTKILGLEGYAHKKCSDIFLACVEEHY